MGSCLENKYSRSKKLSWYMAIAGTLVSCYAIYANMPQVASAVIPASFATSAGIYASKQWSETKKVKEDQPKIL